MLEVAGKNSNMLEIEDYVFPFELCFSRPIMLNIMLAYCINASVSGTHFWTSFQKNFTLIDSENFSKRNRDFARRRGRHNPPAPSFRFWNTQKTPGWDRVKVQSFSV